MRYRCGACGNRTRFDVIESRTTKAFQHFTLGGDLTIEEEEVLKSDVESVTCRWCGRSNAIEVIADDEPANLPA